MIEGLGQNIRSTLRAIVIVAFVVAPLAWSLIELVPALWRVLAIWKPETAAAVWNSGASAIVRVWDQWEAIEFWRYVIIAVAFLIASLGAYFGGPYRKYFCALFYSSGLAVLGYLLHMLSVEEWNLLMFAASALSVAAPTVAVFADEWMTWLNGYLGPLGMAGAEFGMLAVIVSLGFASWSLVTGGLEAFQGQLRSAFIGQVDPVFPRANLRSAATCAKARRNAIKAYLEEQKLPPQTYTQVTFSNGGTPYRLIREYVERRQEVHEVNPLRVAAFLEVPKGSPIKAKSVTLETPEEVAGQYVRLKFESEIGAPPAWPMPWDAPDDMLQLLLGRVVDAAILADQHFDSQREDESWKALPFFERIYLDYRPIPPPLECFLGPILGGTLPARVVIETDYPDVFRKALHGGKGKYGQFRNWFGIGIQIERPNLPQGFFSRLTRVLGGKTPAVRIDRTPWFTAPAPCRRLKSRTSGGVSGKLKLQLSVPSSVPNQRPLESETLFHVMSSGPLADGCPSVVSSQHAEPPTVARGGVSNMPAMWLLPPKSELHTTCKTICVNSVLPGDTETITIDLANEGTVHRASRNIFGFYNGPPTVGRLRARAWVGAFFDRDLRQASRFPLLACSKLLGDGGGSGKRTDFRGAFVRDFWNTTFGGVFVATQGPEHASNLLLPEPLLNDYITHFLAGGLADVMPQVEEPPFVPSPEIHRAR